jgi:hypothetical protein
MKNTLRRALPLLGVAALTAALSGCVQRLADFTALSSRNANIPGERGERVEGEDMATIILFFPTGQPNIKTAVDRAIEKGGGDLLVDGVISQKCWDILLFGQCGYVVEGTPVKLHGSIRGGAGNSAPAPAPATGVVR